MLVIFLGLTIATAVIINCRHQFNSWTNYGTIHECIVYHLEFGKNDVVEGVNVIRYGKAVEPQEIQSFFLTSLSQNIPSGLSQGLATHFPNLKVLVIARTELKFLNSKDLKPFKQLTNLNVDNNKIEYLERGLFEHNPNIKSINLMENPIKKVDNGVFKTLKNLEHLNFSNNECYRGIANSLSEVRTLVEEIYENCKSADYETSMIDDSEYDNVEHSSSSKLTSYALIIALLILALSSR